MTKEWVKKTSSRIWRGSLAKHVWKYLSKGAWAPKKNPKPGRQRRSGSATKHPAPKQKAQGGPSVSNARAQNEVTVHVSATPLMAMFLHQGEYREVWEVNMEVVAGEVTDGTGTGASMDLDSAAEEEQGTHVDEHKRAKPGRKRKRAVAAAADGDAAAAQGGEEGGATHSNSGVPDNGGFGFNDGIGLSSRDEAQVSVHPTPIKHVLEDDSCSFACKLAQRAHGVGPM